MRTRRSLTPISIICSMFLLLIILVVSILSFIELSINYIWDELSSKYKILFKI